MIIGTYPSVVNTWRSEREVGDVPGYEAQESDLRSRAGMGIRK